VSNFPFVDDDALRANLDTAIQHVAELVAIADTFLYRVKLTYKKW